MPGHFIPGSIIPPPNSPSPAERRHSEPVSRGFGYFRVLLIWHVYLVSTVVGHHTDTGGDMTVSTTDSGSSCWSSKPRHRQLHGEGDQLWHQTAGLLSTTSGPSDQGRFLAPLCPCFPRLENADNNSTDLIRLLVLREAVENSLHPCQTR